MDNLKEAAFQTKSWSHINVKRLSEHTPVQSRQNPNRLRKGRGHKGPTLFKKLFTADVFWEKKYQSCFQWNVIVNIISTPGQATCLEKVGKQKIGSIVSVCFVWIFFVILIFFHSVFFFLSFVYLFWFSIFISLEKERKK